MFFWNIRHTVALDGFILHEKNRLLQEVFLWSVTLDTILEILKQHVILYLIQSRMQCEELSMAVWHALVLIVAVDFLIGYSIQKVRQQSIRLRVLQVKYTASPAATWSVINWHGPSLQIILGHAKVSVLYSVNSKRNSQGYCAIILLGLRFFFFLHKSSKDRFTWSSW